MARRKRKLTLYTFDCTGCGYCVKVCGNGVLKLVDNGFCRFVNVADASRCNGCGRCESRCRYETFTLKPNDTMKKKLKIAGFALAGVALLAFGVAVTMWLWNALIPEIIGWKSIGYWQALGLLLLLRLLFGHIGHVGHAGMPRARRRHIHDVMHGMSRDEKREFIRRRMRGLCEREQSADGTETE